MSVPIVPVGELILLEDDRDKLQEYLHKHFNSKLKYHPPKQTALCGR